MAEADIVRSQKSNISATSSKRKEILYSYFCECNQRIRFSMNTPHRKGEIIASVQTWGHGWHLVSDFCVHFDSTPSPTSHLVQSMQNNNDESWNFPCSQPHCLLRVGLHERSGIWDGPHFLQGLHAVLLLLLSMYVSRCERRRKNMKKWKPELGNSKIFCAGLC